MDINLQGDDGIRGCEFIARHPATRDIPLVVATGLTGRGIINDAFSAGASDFLQKPVPGELLTVRLGMLLKLRAVDSLREAV